MKRTLSVVTCVAVLLSSGCLGRGSNADPVTATLLGLGAAAVSRSQGGCYASCPVGTKCNGKTGYCEELPCHGRCAPDERCDTTTVERCVRHAPDLEVRGQGTDARQIKLAPP